MGVRPPQQSSSDPDAIEFGIAALNARLDEANVQFPATSDEILAQVDNTAIPSDGSGTTLELGEALDRVPRDRFDNETELLNLLHPVFEEHRAANSSGLIGQIRSMFPL